IKKYCAENRITDLVFAFNIFNAYSGSAAAACERFLTQGDNTFSAPAAIPGLGKPENEKSDSSRSRKDVKQQQPTIPDQPSQEPAPASKPDEAPSTPAEPSEPAVSD
ncbi:MAG: hypothetical protein K2N91_01870, partial [Muribaculaceae bacterium]|nr:hypothetical protein [Muribaculaceae bacterium]